MVHKRHQISFNLKFCEENTSHWEKQQEKETWEKTSYKVVALFQLFRQSKDKALGTALLLNRAHPSNAPSLLSTPVSTDSHFRRAAETHSHSHSNSAPRALHAGLPNQWKHLCLRAHTIFLHIPVLPRTETKGINTKACPLPPRPGDKLTLRSANSSLYHKSTLQAGYLQEATETGTRAFSCFVSCFMYSHIAPWPHNIFFTGHCSKNRVLTASVLHHWMQQVLRACLGNWQQANKDLSSKYAYPTADTSPTSFPSTAGKQSPRHISITHCKGQKGKVQTNCIYFLK